MQSEQLRDLLEAQQKIIQQIALEADLPLCLNTICIQIEAILHDTGARASILVLDGEHLRHGAGPSLPEDYNRQIDGLKIGLGVGSCGTAAASGKQVIVSDIATHPYWAVFKQIAAQHDLKACWSTPIFSSNGTVLGTFAIYYPYIYSPTEFHQELIERFTNFASLTIERAQSRRREAQLVEQLAVSNAKLEGLVDVIPDLVIVLDEQGNYVDIYGAGNELLYKNESHFIGRNVRDVLPEKLADEILQVVQRALSSGIVQRFEYALDTRQGECVFDGRVATIYNYSIDQTKKHHVLWIARDITEQKRAEQHIERLAFYDLLTGLPNRRLLFDRLQMLMDKSRRDLAKVAVLYIDLNDFKRINDSLGHAVGDILLTQVAVRLSPVKRSSDTLARIGGDEFVLIVDSSHQIDVDIVDDAVTVCKRLLKTLSKPFELENGSYKIGASIGICVVDELVNSAGDLLKKADSAMYAAKKLGGNSFCFYDPSIQEEIDRKLQVEREIITAIDQRQICAYFQPQIDAVGRLVGAEALIRWLHPGRGLISPLGFVSIAEHSGLIFQLQNVVLEDACKLINGMKQDGYSLGDFSVSVNISSGQFKTGKLDENLLRILGDFDVPARHIILEITESLLMQNRAEAVPQMNRLKELGFRFSVDDFGTGYSSLSYLHALPLDELKIDKSFVDQLDTHQSSEAIIDSIISLAGHLHLNVVAEGVETQKQYDLLAQRQIHAMQGYLFAKPMPMDEFRRYAVQMRDVGIVEVAITPI